MSSRLVFSEGNHAYRLAPPGGGDRVRVPSVTTLIGQLAKPALVRWAAKTAAGAAVDDWDRLSGLPPSERLDWIARAADRSTRRAAVRGTAIHAWAEALIAGQPVDVPADMAGQVEVFARWWEGSGFAPVEAEVRLFADADDFAGTAYAGTADLIAEHPAHGTVLIDWKTGGVWPEHAIQLAAYAGAEWLSGPDGDAPMPAVDRLLVGQIGADGVDLHEVTPDQRRVAAQVFELLRLLRDAGRPELRQVAG